MDNQQQDMANPSNGDDHETYLSDTEIDSYIISVPKLPKRTPKQCRTPKRSKEQGGKSHSAASRPSVEPAIPLINGEPSTPRSLGHSDQQNNEEGKANAEDGPSATPRSLGDGVSDERAARWATASIVEEPPATPRKKRGWFGTDGRAWVQGTKSPSRTKPWIET